MVELSSNSYKSNPQILFSRVNDDHLVFYVPLQLISHNFQSTLNIFMISQATTATASTQELLPERPGQTWK